MYAGFPEEGDKCKCGKGNLIFPSVENCACHISPPCSNCQNLRLTCSNCGWVDDSPDTKDVFVTQGLYRRECRPRPLDTSKVNYRIKSHTYFTQICEGVYPEGSTKDDVRQVVNGTFGGVFETFKDGKFKFIAYTD